MDIPGLRQQILANANQAIAFRFPEHDAASTPKLLTHRSGDAVKAVLISSDDDNHIVRLSGEEADTTVGALQNILTTTELVLEEVINAWDARQDAVMEDGDAAAESDALATLKNADRAKQETNGHQEEGEESAENEVVPPSTKRKPGRPKKVVGKRGRPRKSAVGMM